MRSIYVFIKTLGKPWRLGTVSPGIGALPVAVAAGLVAFLLALCFSGSRDVRFADVRGAAIPGIICGLLCWLAARRSFAAIGAALDAAIARLAQAANGDLRSPVPHEVKRRAPRLARAMERLFGQLNSNLENVQRLAMVDPVTGLANRIGFRRNCEHVLADMSDSRRAAMFFIDLDRFKQVNDTLGHAEGDMLLSLVANRLCAVAGRFAGNEGFSPLVGRIAGDEFTLFYPDIVDAAEADRVGRAILGAFDMPFTLTDQPVQVGASVGVAIYPGHGVTLNELMRAADAAMYHAKAHGRGRVELFGDRLAGTIAGRAQMESDLREALDQGQFALVFQPQVNARTGAVVGAEALLRWLHPDGLRMPLEFIQRAEESGLIVEIGEWVTQQVAQTIRRWHVAGMTQRLGVNISARQLDHATFFLGLRKALRDADAPAALLELELTETLAMNCSDEVLDAIAALRGDGASVAIDDFGTGYSNMARLQRLPVDRIKLDRTLIVDIAERAETRAIAQAVIALIHGIGCEAVAEAIETPAQAETLRIIGCDILQGYAIAEPMPEDHFLEWMGRSEEQVTLRRPA